MNRALRALRTTSGIVLPLALALWGAMAVALGPAPEEKFAVAAAPTESYALVAGRFAPVSASRFAAADETAYSALPSATVGSVPASSPTPAPTSSRQAALTVRISADRDRAAPGGKITYTVVVRNVGTADASNVVAESHVPAGTSMATGDGCVNGGGTATSPCLPVDQPGEGGSSRDHISQRFDTIVPGGLAVWRFTVTVNLDTPVKTVIRNHAHAAATDVPSVTSDDVVMTVQ